VIVTDMPSRSSSLRATSWFILLFLDDEDALATSRRGDGRVFDESSRCSASPS